MTEYKKYGKGMVCICCDREGGGGGGVFQKFVKIDILGKV